MKARGFDRQRLFRRCNSHPGQHCRSSWLTNQHGYTLIVPWAVTHVFREDIVLFPSRLVVSSEYRNASEYGKPRGWSPRNLHRRVQASQLRRRSQRSSCEQPVLLDVPFTLLRSHSPKPAAVAASPAGTDTRVLVMPLTIEVALAT